MTRLTRTKKCAAAVAIAAAAMAAVPAVAQAVAPMRVPAEAQGRQAEAPANEAAPVRVVAPGERVQAGAGVEIWLTEEGKHWSTPETGHQFRSAVDGNLDLRHPSVGLSTEILGDRCFLSGLYTGTDHARSVVVSTGDGEVTAPLVRLPGSPGWGAWYADVPLHDDLTIDRVTLLDGRGKKIASMTPSRP
ncbi:hypothetical protein OG206_01215 [Streptomyces sp. NBC_01341]|uniref:hypothetical protein n=1 Tax=Streptomyces sp. NBC_01341 TaxID=2903831 RepID=UPI002E126289|nr:hypothetical protein OG206_01215 [Streptomyces sp. NBC_01341]